MHEFDLNLLRVVLAIYDEGSVSNAGKVLGMSQPAASAALSRLRARIGDPLFVKTSRGMEPTPRAAALVPIAREILERVSHELLTSAAFDSATTRTRFTFAMSDIGEMVFLPRLLEYLSKHAPNAQIRSVSTTPRQVETSLETGDVDLAIGYFPDLKKNSFFQQRLFSHYFVCLLRVGHPLRGKKLTLKQFLALNHAVVRAEGRSQEILERFFEKKSIQRKIALLTPHFMSIPMIIARSDLVVTVPHALGRYFETSGAGVRVVEPPMRLPSIEVKQHWHRKFHRDAKVAWLRKVVSELFNDKTDEWKL
ncbi:MAG: LysR family transcriptional regulator [Proteobacteria bacterium]|nr:LysR family transcriptional regulator [Pseudomonadota bacterium]